MIALHHKQWRRYKKRQRAGQNAFFRNILHVEKFSSKSTKLAAEISLFRQNSGANVNIRASVGIYSYLKIATSCPLLF